MSAGDVRTPVPAPPGVDQGPLVEAGCSALVLRSSDSYVRKEFSETPQGRTAKGV